MKEQFSRISESIKDFVTDPKNRRYIIGGAVLLVALAVILISMLGKKTIENIDTDCRYPYAFSANDRVATVTISGPFAEGAVWGAENSDPDVISVTERKQNQKKAVFNIKPVSQGNAHIEFRLKEPTSDFTFDIRIDLFVDPEKKINIIGGSHYDRRPEFMPVSGSDIEYAVTYDDMDAMHVLIRSAEAPEWAVDSLNPEVFEANRVTQFEAVEVSPSDVVSGSDPTPVVYVDTGLVEFEVYGYTEGTGVLRFVNNALGVEFELYLYVDSVGIVSSVPQQLLDEIEAERLLEQAEAEAQAAAEGEPDYYSADYFDDLNDQFIQSLIDQQAAEQQDAASEEQAVEEQPTTTQATTTQATTTQPTEELPPEEQPVVA